jgi:DNA-binding response OmpR family regulator
MRPVKILYAESDADHAYLTGYNLEQNNYDVTQCSDGETCLEAFRNESFDVCIIDLVLPKMDGVQVSTAIRKINPSIPLCFLSANNATWRATKLKARDAAYLVKPFSIDELTLKIEMLLVRAKLLVGAGSAVYMIGKFLFNSNSCLLYNEREKIALTPREAELLKYFLDNKERVLKREQILTALWGHDDYFMGRNLDEFIGRLRRILSEEKHVHIEKLHNIGFRYSEKAG